MFTNIKKDRSTTSLALAIQEWGNKKLIAFTNFDEMMEGLDKDFIINEEGQLIRRQTGRLVDGGDRNFSLMTKANVADKSFGAHVSLFKARTATVEEQASTETLLRHYRIPAEHKTFIKNNFVTDKGELRKLDKATGYISTASWAPKDVVQKITGSFDAVDVDMMERQEEVSYKNQAKDLLRIGEDEKVLKTLFANIKATNAPKYNALAHDFVKQEEDMKKKSLTFVGILYEKDLTVAEQNKTLVLQKVWMQKLNEL